MDLKPYLVNDASMETLKVALVRTLTGSPKVAHKRTAEEAVGPAFVKTIILSELVCFYSV